MGIKEEISELLKQLDCISVRDGNSAEVVRVLTGKNPLRHVDPVLIFDYTRYMPSKVKRQDTSLFILILVALPIEKK